MSTTYVDAQKLKQQLVMDSSIIVTNKGQLIPVQKVLDCVDFAAANYANPNLTESPLNIKKCQRRLHRAKQHLKELRDNEKNLSEWGKHDLGYFKGYVAALENLFDELDIEVEE